MIKTKGKIVITIKYFKLTEEQYVALRQKECPGSLNILPVKDGGFIYKFNDRTLIDLYLLFRDECTKRPNDKYKGFTFYEWKEFFRLEDMFRQKYGISIK